MYRTLQRFLLLILCLHIKGYAQTNDSITLPAGNIDMKIYGPTIILEIYVTQDQKVYFNNKRLEYFDQICSMLKENYRDRTIHEDRKVAIIADVGINYNFIDKIKEQLGCIRIGRVYYKTGNFDDLTYQYNLLNGSTLDVNNSERIPTTQEEYEYKELRSRMPAPPDEFDYFVLMRTLHNGSKKEIVDWLEKYSFNSLRLIGDSKFIYNDQILDYNDEGTLEEIILNSENLLIQYGENLKYGEYVQFTQIKNELAIKHKINLNEKMIGELSLQAEERLEKLGVIIN